MFIFPLRNSLRLNIATVALCPEAGWLLCVWRLLHLLIWWLTPTTHQCLHICPKAGWLFCVWRLLHLMIRWPTPTTCRRLHVCHKAAWLLCAWRLLHLLIRWPMPTTYQHLHDYPKAGWLLCVSCLPQPTGHDNTGANCQTARIEEQWKETRTLWQSTICNHKDPLVGRLHEGSQGTTNLSS